MISTTFAQPMPTGELLKFTIERKNIVPFHSIYKHDAAHNMHILMNLFLKIKMSYFFKLQYQGVPNKIIYG